jgi:hypothetical protein
MLGRLRQEDHLSSKLQDQPGGNKMRLPLPLSQLKKTPKLVIVGYSFLFVFFLSFFFFFSTGV